MTRWQLVYALRKAQPGLTLNKARCVVESMFEAMAEAFERGIDVSISDFGIFKVSTRKAYVSRSPIYLRKMVSPINLIYFKTFRILRINLNKAPNSID